MAMAASPKDFMKTNTRRIIIHEKNQQSRSNGIATPTITREIVIKESDSETFSPTISEENSGYGSRSPSPSLTTSDKPNLRRKESRSPSPTLCVSSSVYDSRLRSRSASPDTKNVTLDPRPQSHTILTKTASASAARATSASRARRSSQNIISLSPTVQSRVNEENKEKDADNVKGGDGALQKAKASLIAVSQPKDYRMLPDECGAKYERFTYLPDVKRIPSDTPSWKVPILHRKNKQAIDIFLQKKEVEKQRIEEERVLRKKEEAIPEWKRPIVKAVEKRHQLEKSKAFEKAQMKKKELDRFNSLPPWRQELIIRQKEQDRLDDLPGWQKDLILKKKVATTKSTFEKHDINENTNSVPWSKHTLRRTQHTK